MSDMASEQSVREAAERRKRDGARLITIVGRDAGEGMLELTYVYDWEGGMEHDRFAVPFEREVDSIADIYAGALNMEREVVDLLGARFKGVQPGLLLVPGKSREAPLRLPPAEEGEHG